MQYAFDKNNNIIYAKDLDSSSSGIRFKCANPSCNGEVMLRNSNSNYISSCFYFKPNIKDKFGVFLHNHINKCYALKPSKSIKYDVNDFNFDDFIINLNPRTPNNQRNITHQNNNSNPNKNSLPKIRTLKQLYNFCSSALPYTKLGNILVKDLFVGERTVLYYKSKQKNISSQMLFHLKRIYKSENFSQLEFDAKCSSPNKIFLKFKIKFNDKTLFKNILNSFFYNKSNVKLKKAKFDFLILAIPGELTPIENSKFYIQELIVTDSSYIHIL